MLIACDTFGVNKTLKFETKEPKLGAALVAEALLVLGAAALKQQEPKSPLVC